MGWGGGGEEEEEAVGQFRSGGAHFFPVSPAAAMQAHTTTQSESIPRFRYLLQSSKSCYLSLSFPGIVDDRGLMLSPSLLPPLLVPPILSWKHPLNLGPPPPPPPSSNWRASSTGDRPATKKLPKKILQTTFPLPQKNHVRSVYSRVRTRGEDLLHLFCVLSPRRPSVISCMLLNRGGKKKKREPVISGSLHIPRDQRRRGREGEGVKTMAPYSLGQKDIKNPFLPRRHSARSLLLPWRRRKRNSFNMRLAIGCLERKREKRKILSFDRKPSTFPLLLSQFRPPVSPGAIFPPPPTRIFLGRTADRRPSLPLPCE